jgi:hypothetical protein
MLISILMLLLITLGGMFLTYLYDREGPLMVRLCAGNVIGSAIFGLSAFVLACFFGLTVTVVLASAAITLLPLLLLAKQDIRAGFQRDWRKAKGKLEGTTNRKILGLCYYCALILLLFLFFDRAMIEDTDGIYTGIAHNLGDLHYHLDAIYSFTEGQNFPPENPSYAGVKFTYPFMADIISACFVVLGAGVRRAMFWQNLFLGFSLVVLLENFTFRLTQNRLAAKLAPLFLLFSGGLGFLLAFKDFWYGAQDLSTFLWNLPNDYTIRFTGGLRWGNSLNVLFVTQRSLLLGMPLALIIFTYIWDLFNWTEQPDEPAKRNWKPNIYSSLFVGLLAGSLPLVHAHSLLVVGAVAGFAALCTLKYWKEWTAFFIGILITAIPELAWAMSGSATRAKEFIDWHFGWDKGDLNFLLFWLFNTGLFIPLLLIVLGVMVWHLFYPGEKKSIFVFDNSKKLLLFYVPFGLFFVISNIMKLAPWEWDNIKVLIYWFVGSLPLVSLLLVKIWERGKWEKFLVTAAVIVLTFSGALDVWHVISQSQAHRIADADELKIAEDIKRLTPPRALFLNAPTFKSAVGLSGRRSLMRYPGHLSSHGIDYGEREEDVKRMYAGVASADTLMKKYNIEYIFVGPEERKDMKAREDYLNRYQVIAEEGAYRVYKVK